MTMDTIFEDMPNIDVEFQDNVFLAFCNSKDELNKEILEVNVEEHIQELIDDNELQTAVLAAVFIKIRDPKILSETFLETIILFYKQTLKDYGLIHWSSKIAMKASLTEPHDVGRGSPNAIQPNYKAKMYCGACQVYRSSQFSQCDCEQVCVFCSLPLKNGLLMICKVCGHAGHVDEYKNYFR